MVTTGVGPQWCKITYFQPPDSAIDPALRDLEQPFNTVHVFGDNTTNVPLPRVPPTAPIVSLPPLSAPSHVSSFAFADDENVPLPSQKCGPKPSPFSNDAMEKARASIKLLPKKRTFEESIIDLSNCVSHLL